MNIVYSLFILFASDLFLRYFKQYRGVAQPGRALLSGSRCRRFKSSRPDQKFANNINGKWIMSKNQIRRSLFAAMVLPILVVILPGCASKKVATSQAAANPHDPYEHVNRQIFAFNMALDHAVLRPIAKTYDFVLPWPVKKGIHNIFDNIGDVTSAANEILQLHFDQAVADLARVVINTTIGVGGLFDVATPMGVVKNKQDFGMTLAHWGCHNTPYVMLPFFGPATVRDAVGLPVNMILLDPWTYGASTDVQIGAFGVYQIQYRASLLVADKVVDQAFDPYVLVRDAYLQHRRHVINASNTRIVGIHAGKHVAQAVAANDNDQSS